jgi:hypothetical protein
MGRRAVIIHVGWDAECGYRLKVLMEHFGGLRRVAVFSKADALRSNEALYPDSVGVSTYNHVIK